MIIYRLYCRPTGKSYIGQTVHSLAYRVRGHFKPSRMLKLTNLMARAAAEFGRENFDAEILQQCESREEMDAAERKWILHFNSQAPNGYNVSSGGQNSGYTFKGMVPRQSEHNQRIAISMVGHSVSSEAKQKISDARKGRSLASEARLIRAERGLGKRETTPHGRGEKSLVAKLTWEDVRRIRALYKIPGNTHSALAEKFGVARTTVAAICQHRTWVEDDPFEWVDEPFYA